MDNIYELVIKLSEYNFILKVAVHSWFRDLPIKPELFFYLSLLITLYMWVSKYREKNIYIPSSFSSNK